MKNLDLNAYGVVELTQQEMIAVEGGSWLGDAFKNLGDLFLAIGEAINEFWKKIRHGRA